MAATSFDAIKAAAGDIPDADHIWMDGNGDAWFRFLIEYNGPECVMATDIWARDIEHAETLLASLKASGDIVGQAYRTLEEW